MTDNQENIPRTHENPFTVADDMIWNRISNQVIFNGHTAAHRFASDMASDSFQICMDKTMEEVMEYITYWPFMKPFIVVRNWSIPE